MDLRFKRVLPGLLMLEGLPGSVGFSGLAGF